MSPEIKFILFLMGIQMLLYIGAFVLGYGAFIDYVIKKKGGTAEDPIERILNRDDH